MSVLTTATAPGLACLCLQHEFVHFTDLEQVDSVLTTATAPGLAMF